MTCMTGVPNSALNSGEGANRPVKELLYVQFSGRFEILVPKIRGTGYLKTPLGHHENDLSALGGNLGFDLMGLDGALEVYGPGMSSLSRRDVERVMVELIPALVRYYKMPARMVSLAEFRRLHPIKATDANYGG
ncbi:hypothetical protein ACR3H8_19875 [Pseudomonas aeruginosa]|uniref:hypothetical protein n=1 Tax=Pseudomonas aeruginosa group TaxID=136841 RepID=UPI0003BAEE60|nr:hypothetical protein [Pseudomonas aeruginosa]EIU2716149.1 hypothetical protein [Pseudomonas aeruginosa]EIU2862968.1 hypothetical protein [Pseudomonas aeruginosa]ELD5772771.1 hypothetical protein [Pseudomonas aeruginosa]ERW61396.1 hypothetical protein Q024_06443 [Pseudomonas aeruginosa BWHPSA011]ETV55859.1 hypothetical protein Q042_05268 [Pseudomonas aeruginosa BWHPSA037]